ncbi:unnamed protein product [Gongylonema pulchrum]|uniref:glucuronosyltransferase n=1 Tax=Gongylonema pulchrum TaxID=637853 RepID=A0A3P7NK65_9BILA|nr:unnamed protein product [Gongylonema pulchrum]
MVDFPRPVTHNIVYIGGLGLTDAKALESPFSEFMKKGEKGVILVSFGSIITTKNMPRSFVSAIVDVIKAFPHYHFIFKMDKGDEVFFFLSKKISSNEMIQ